MAESLDKTLQAFLDALEEHNQAGQLGYLLYDLLSDAGYDDDDIVEAATALVDAATEGETTQ